MGQLLTLISKSLRDRQFEDPRDADDAIYGRDGYDFDGFRLRVELARGGRHSSSDRYSSYSHSSSSRGVSRRSDYRVLVTGLPPSVSWQDLKDHMRRAGDVCFSQVFHDRGGMTGIVDYTNYEDMKYAVREYDSRRSYSKSPSYDYRRSYSRSPSRTPYMSRSPSVSRSYSYGGRSRSISPEATYSRSRSRSWTRSRSPNSSPRPRTLSRPR